MSKKFINLKQYIKFRRYYYKSLYYDTKNSMLNIDFDLLEKVIEAKEKQNSGRFPNNKIQEKTKNKNLITRIKKYFIYGRKHK
jgi:hypothetical protein